MIIEDIKNSVRNAFYRIDQTINFHFEEALRTDFPYVIFSIKDFKVERYNAYGRQKFDFLIELVYAKSKDNKILDLINAQEEISRALLPVIDILGKKITLDNVVFKTSNKQLIMTFNLSLYTYENENYETMQILDLTMKEDKNA